MPARPKPNPRDYHTITICTAPEPRTDGTIITIDGVELKSVVDVQFEHHAGLLPVVVISLHAAVDLKGIAAVLESKGSFDA